ncbi:PP2C family protein-serine/threonine phosphatase [Streptomyces sp. NPDC058374]|uniref:PP2C family protein-serine/threonine phosphatase n=1 Tax=unclassified Streptomyces TaxID=2593676 RepID=UPI0036601BE7
MFRTKPVSRAARSRAAGGARPARHHPLASLVPALLWGAAVLGYKYACPFAQRDDLPTRIGTSAVLFAVGAALIARIHRSLLRDLRRIDEVAGAAQGVLLRPLPARLDGLALAARRFSAHPAASVGGDLYEAVATDHGVRVVIGDVRGHGLTAIGTVATVLGSFREAAHDEPALGGVLRRLDRALTRDLRRRARLEHPANAPADPEHPLAEEFVTLLLLEIRPDGTLLTVNCGHPWPHLLSAGAEPLSRADPLPPLGPFPLPTDLPVRHCGRLLPGQGLVLHTDGVEDARDPSGRFFPLVDTLCHIADGPFTAQTAATALHSALVDHSQGPPADDAAVVVLCSERSRTVPPQGGGREPWSAPQPSVQ